VQRKRLKGASMPCCRFQRIGSPRIHAGGRFSESCRNGDILDWDDFVPVSFAAHQAGRPDLVEEWKGGNLCLASPGGPCALPRPLEQCRGGAAERVSLEKSAALRRKTRAMHRLLNLPGGRP